MLGHHSRKCDIALSLVLVLLVVPSMGKRTAGCGLQRVSVHSLARGLAVPPVGMQETKRHKVAKEVVPFVDASPVVPLAPDALVSGCACAWFVQACGPIGREQLGRSRHGSCCMPCGAARALRQESAP